MSAKIILDRFNRSVDGIASDLRSTSSASPILPPPSTTSPPDDDNVNLAEVDLLKDWHTDHDRHTDHNDRHTDHNDRHTDQHTDNGPHGPGPHNNHDGPDTPDTDRQLLVYANNWKAECKKRQNPHWCYKLLKEMLKYGHSPGVTLPASERKKIQEFCQQKVAHEPEYKKAKKLRKCRRKEAAFKLNEKYGVHGRSDGDNYVAFARQGDKGTDHSKVLLIGGAVGILVLLVIIGLLLYCCFFAGSKAAKPMAPKKTNKSSRGGGGGKSSKKSSNKKSGKGGLTGGPKSTRTGRPNKSKKSSKK